MPQPMHRMGIPALSSPLPSPTMKVMHRPSADLLTPAPGTVMATPLDPHTIRPDFPILGMQCHKKPLVYLDNAATTQKPKQVIDADARYYTCQNANIHRGV